MNQIRTLPKRLHFLYRMTNPTPHQPAPENVSKEAIDGIRANTAHINIETVPGIDANWHKFYLRAVRTLLAKIDELETLHAQGKEAFDTVQRLADVGAKWSRLEKADMQAEHERLNAQKDALIAAQKDYIDWLEADGVNDSYHRQRIAQANSLLAKTDDSYAGKVVLDAEAVENVKFKLIQMQMVIETNSWGPYDLSCLRSKVAEALSLLDAPTANPENGKDGK